LRPVNPDVDRDVMVFVESNPLLCMLYHYGALYVAEPGEEIPRGYAVIGIVAGKGVARVRFTVGDTVLAEYAGDMMGDEHVFMAFPTPFIGPVRVNTPKESKILVVDMRRVAQEWLK